MKARKLFTTIYSRSALWCVLAGVVYSLAFFNGCLFVFGLLGQIMFCACLLDYNGEKFSVSKPVKKTFFFSIGSFLPLYTWFTALYPFEAYDLTPLQGIFVVVAANIGLALLHTGFNCAASLLWKVMPKQKVLLPVCYGCVVATGELLMSLGEVSLPWGLVAVNQYKFTPLMLNVSLLGPFFIAVIVGTFAGYTAMLIKSRDKHLLVFSVSSILVPVMMGGLIYIHPVHSNGSFKAAVVQGNVLSMEKWDSEKLSYIIDAYTSMAREAAENGADVIVLPETAIPVALNSSIKSSFESIAAENDCTVLLSMIVKSNGKKYNSLFAIYPDGTMSDFYNKQHLVPFGEYLPFSEFLEKLFPFVKSLNLGSTTYIAGNESKVLQFQNDRKFGCLICFDSVFPSLTRESVQNGAEIIILPTNDSWYRDSAGVYQHMSHAVLRAVESGKYIIRSANTGISGFISPKGVVSNETKPLEKTISYSTVYTNNIRTAYSYTGDIILILPILAVTYGVYGKIKEKRGKDFTDLSLRTR